jgi:cellulose synthase (UDP-forming)
MPETFEGYLKQRKRWAMGCIQVLLRDNPLTKRGLTLAQRLDYLGSIFYFFFGLPRVICLVAPLASLLFHTPPLHADITLLALHFFPFYIASALAMRPVTRGSRNPFWSDIYEIAMCFALSAVAFKALAAPRKERAFEVTPKGQRVKKNTSAELTLAWPHVATFGLLIGGLSLGIQDLRHGTADAGLPVSLFWGTANLILLTIAMFVASEQPQGRQAFRLNRDFVGELFMDSSSTPVRILNINESGAALSLEHPVFTAQPTVTLLLTSSQGTIVRLSGRLMRQERLPSGDVLAGIQFVELDDPTAELLVDKIFGDPAPWEESYRIQPGIASSVRSLLHALASPWKSLTWEQRRMPRVSHETSCRLRTSTVSLAGTLEDMSFTGVRVRFPSTPSQSLVGSHLILPLVTLKVSPVSMTRRYRKVIVHFTVESIERGEARWRALHQAEWSRL